MRLVVALPVLALGLACAAPQAAVRRGDDGTRLVEVRGAELRVLELAPAGLQESREAVVFVHGYGSRLESWKLVQPRVAQAHRTVSLDQRGFGLSDRTAPPAPGFGPQAHADDVIALLDALHIERAVIVGHSYGCGVALRAAMQHPERITGVVLVSPFALEEQLNAFLRWARVPLVGEWLFATTYKDFPGEKYLMAFADRERFVSVAALDDVQAIMAREGSSEAALATVRGMDYAAVEDGYATIRQPVRVVWGEQDRVTPVRQAPLLQKRLPQATITKVPGVGHMPPWEAPDAVVAAVTAVTTTSAPASAPPVGEDAE